MDRLKNPATWIGFAIVALALVNHGAFGALPPVYAHAVTDATELLGLVGAWFFGAGMLAPATPTTTPVQVITPNVLR